MSRPIALGWVDDDASLAPDWDRAQIRRLAYHLGYRIVWPCERSVLPVVDQARNADADAVIMPSPTHLGILELDSLMRIADVETVLPRLTFARWALAGVAQ